MNTYRNFIKYFLLVLVVLFANISSAQYTITPSDTIEVYQNFNTLNYYKVNINNITSDTLHMHWKSIQYDTIGGTYFDFCASGICYTGFPFSGSFPLIAPGTFGWAGAHFYTGSVPVTSTAKVTLTEGLSETGVTITFILHAANTTGIENNHLSENLISVYPNPAKDNLTVKLDIKSTRETSISLYNVFGELVYSTTTKISLTDIPLKGIGEGLYFLNILTDKKKYVKKIIVKK